MWLAVSASAVGAFGGVARLGRCAGVVAKSCNLGDGGIKGGGLRRGWLRVHEVGACLLYLGRLVALRHGQHKVDQGLLSLAVIGEELSEI